MYLYLLKFGNHSVTESANFCLGGNNGGRGKILDAFRRLSCTLPGR
jgi:hypothetical protein